MLGKRKKQKKKKVPFESMVSLTANGEPVDAINFATVRDKEGNPRIEIRTKDVCEALHYDTVAFELKTNNKLIKIDAKFLNALNEKKFKLYVFEPESYSQFFQ